MEKINIAKIILKLCDQYEITPNKLARLAGMHSSTTLQDIVNEKNKSPRIGTIEKICAGLGMTLADFFSETKKPDLPPEALQELRHYEEYLRYKYNIPGK
ncbi:MAG TPA: helix-turn-helix transcriptional regulator [Methylomusa anaerophila]|uniref:HTH cro/C1-type domain-containing protein n=1 Tax=Methylomusa anaerophila TaxID=1930071 RepID=A0A348AJ38_9FIRM|nr:helix-turn-helix transcriptional regulator [Methylomusa anaerophila]BBB91086.1 hypothetical protein MAMMFC1_01754 [Methylomusa anaerophila]HML88963.1 helix-turn-helix transcriptional regulator [Methylomusa anaerophila]